MNSDSNLTMMKNIAVLGSTGSIGTQTLDIIEEYPDRYRVSLLTAGRNWQLLANQARKFHPRRVIIADNDSYIPLREALKGLDIEVAAGSQAIADSMDMPETDTVVTAMVGYSGLLPTVNAIRAGKRIALANKETLVAGGDLITRLLADSESDIVPVDSEHSAIFQCLVGESTRKASKIILTASGGPFRTYTREQLSKVTVTDALNHPNWQMGAKVTVDSASMMNKGFEMIEARWLFDCPPDRIQIVVHPQSIVHSMVEFCDGSIKAQLGRPDMHLPIRYALGYPERLPSSAPKLKLEQYGTLTFEAPDFEKFPMLGFAFSAISRGGTMPCILNAANEVAVDAFLHNRIRFVEIPVIAEATMKRVSVTDSPSLDDYIATNAEAVAIAREALSSISTVNA